jgi:hypothetical protein
MVRTSLVMARQTIAILCLRACEYIIRVAVHFVPKADTALAVRSHLNWRAHFTSLVGSWAFPPCKKLFQIFVRYSLLGHFVFERLPD